MKRILRNIIAIFLLLALTACGSIKKADSDPSAGATGSGAEPVMEEPLVKEAENDGRCHIGILVYRDHGASDETIEGFQERFQELMGSTEVVFERMSADGDAEQCSRIATGYANSGYKLIFACGTEAVQNAGAAVKDVPIIGACVTDFLMAEVVSSLEHPGGNISGVSCMGPIDLQIQQITDRLEWPSQVGIIASGTEVGSRFQTSIAGRCLNEKGIYWVSYNADSEDELRRQLEKAVSECSCLYLPTDSFVSSHMDIVHEVVIRAMADLQKTVYVVTGDYHMCRGGGLFCYSIDYKEHGKKAAEMAFAVLEEGAEISRLAVREEEEKDARQYYNPVTAEEMNWSNYGGMLPIIVSTDEQEEQD